MFKISLPQFNGPLELLIYFIKKDNISVNCVPISLIIEDFKTYIENQQKNINELADFILMFSVLIEIKLRKLLPVKEKFEEEISVSLEDILEEYIKYKKAATFLKQRHDQNQQMYPRGSFVSVPDVINLDSKILRNIIEKLIKEKNLSYSTIEEEPVKIEEIEKRIRNFLDLKKNIKFIDLVEMCSSIFEVIVSFFLILELMRKKEIKILFEKEENDLIFSEIKVNSD